MSRNQAGLAQHQGFNSFESAQAAQEKTDLRVLPSPFSSEHGRVLLCEDANASPADLRRSLLDDSYDKPFIFEDGEVRYLYFSLHHIQSAMQIDQPDRLDLRYTQKMMAFLLFNPNPKNLLLFGLGGGSLTKFCYRHLPRTRIRAVEIDPNVIAMRDRFQIPPNDERLEIIEDDAAHYIGVAAPGIDALLIDAFDRHGIAPALTQRDFLEACLEKLSPSGVLVMNIADEKGKCADLIALARSVFDERIIVLPVEEDGNQILFAFRNPQFWPRWRWLESQAKALKTRFGLDFPHFLNKMERSVKRDLMARANQAQPGMKKNFTHSMADPF